VKLAFFEHKPIDLNQTLAELTTLPIQDRLRIVETLWDSINTDARVSISPDQREELTRRIEKHEKDPDDVFTWEQVLDRLRDRQ